jgi:phytoene/squalene synthetase
MKQLFDQVSHRTSTMVTRKYSTSFSLGILALDAELRQPIYDIYGFVRFADEIVDSFHGYDKRGLLDEFRRDTYLAIERGISLNPVLHSFQSTVRAYNINRELIDTFLDSMEMDLSFHEYTQDDYQRYILGSAEVVGLMCLKVFCKGDEKSYKELEGHAMSLGAAFQKINFLRDLKADFQGLGRSYFPNADLTTFDQATKAEIEREIDRDFQHGLEGIRKLPRGSRFGVLVAFVYYYNLFKKIRSLPAERIMHERVRIPNRKKIELLFGTYVKHSFNLL